MSNGKLAPKNSRACTDEYRSVNAEEAQAIAVSSAIQSPSAKRRRLNSIRPSTATAPIPAITAVPGPSAAPATNGDKEYEEDFNRRSFSDRKAALNLRQMRHFDSTLSSDKVKNLIATLTVSSEIQTCNREIANNIVGRSPT